MSKFNNVAGMDAETAGRLERLGFSVRELDLGYQRELHFCTPLFKVDLNELNDICGWECYSEIDADFPMSAYVELFVVFCFQPDGSVSGWINLCLDGAEIHLFCMFDGSAWATVKPHVLKLIKMRE